ncbi:MAG: hypothetical protein RMA76_37585 [Deltaproteobacteria bacterium]|jgi:hypothetical protein
MSNSTKRGGLWSVAVLGFIAACGSVDERPASEEAPQTATTEQGILGSNLCKDVDLIFTNSRERASGNVAIRVRRVKFSENANGPWRSEDFSNRVVGYGDTVTVDNQDLENSYNDDLEHWRIYYNVLQPNGTWGSEVYQQVTHFGDSTCRNYRGYSLVVN